MRFTNDLKELTKNIAIGFGCTDSDNSTDVFNLTGQANLKMREMLRKYSTFLNKINMVHVYEAQGKKLYGSTAQGITGRKSFERHYGEQNHENYNRYVLYETDSSVALPWILFDEFALHKEQFKEQYDEAVFLQIASDIIQIGWTGQSIADNTQEKDLSDVNKGWISLLQEQKPENFITSNKINEGKIKVFGENADYSNLDELALDLKSKLDLRHQNRNDLVFLVGSGFIGKEKKLIVNNLPTSEYELLASQSLINSFGGMRSIIPPNFPAYGAVVTTLRNLSIYTMINTGRYQLKENDESRSMDTRYYRVQGYVVEDLGLMSAIDYRNVILG